MSAAQVLNLGGVNVVGDNGEECDFQSLCGEGKIIGLYFSAHWCPPCRMFTPVLVEFYNKMKAPGKQFEIVFISSDRSEEDFSSYFKDMPWKAFLFADSHSKETLKIRYQISGIPTFIVVDGASGETITSEGRAKVSSDPEGKQFPWRS